MARLDRELRRVVERQRATADEDRKRHDLLRRFGAMLQRRFPGVALRPFGSFVSVFHTAGSDVDVSLEVAPNSPWYDPKEMGPGTMNSAGAKEGGRNNRRNQPPRGYKSKKVQLLSKVASELRFQKFADVRLVAHARVPLIKFHDPRTNVNCDVCVGNDGVYKSAVLGVLANLDERYRDLVHLVKMFAKNFDCNDALGGSFNSYSLSLMSLFHLQTRSPPILPPTLRLTLQSDAAADADLAAENERAANLEPIRKFPVSKIRQQSDQLRDVGPVERRAERYRGVGAENSATLAELFVTFFTHFRAVEPLWRHGLVASAYAGRWVAGCSWAPGRYCLGVEDPFAAGDNVARAVQRRSLPKVLAAIRDGTLAVARVAWARSDDDLQRALADLLGPDAAPPPEMPTQGWPSLGGDGGGENASAVNAAHLNAQHPLGHPGHPLGRPAPPVTSLLNLGPGPVAGGPGVSSEAFGMDRRAAAFGDRGAPPPGFAAPGFAFGSDASANVFGGGANRALGSPAARGAPRPGGGFLGGPPPPPAGLGGPPRFGFPAPGFGPPMGAPAPRAAPAIAPRHRGRPRGRLPAAAAAAVVVRGARGRARLRRVGDGRRRARPRGVRGRSRVRRRRGRGRARTEGRGLREDRRGGRERPGRGRGRGRGRGGRRGREEPPREGRGGAAAAGRAGRRRRRGRRRRAAARGGEVARRRAGPGRGEGG